MTKLSERFDAAVAYARTAHAAQVRKGSQIPYLYHLLGVSSLVLEFGGDEDQAIAALLHDVVEDCGAQHELLIRAQFGDRVADIVKVCTDGSQESKAQHTIAEAKYRDWLQRKLDYVAHLRKSDEDALLVSGCDKLHNARAILQDLRDPEVAMKVFDRFTGALHGTLRYYQTLAGIAQARNAPMARELSLAVEELHVLAEVPDRFELDHEVYRIRVYDNFHYQNEEEAYDRALVFGAQAALVEARSIVRGSLREVAKHGMSADEVYKLYVSFGEDPAILGTPAVKFSGWDYARSCAEEVSDPDW